MYAIVLTYDDRHYLANLTVAAYCHLWKNNNFTFLIPYNNSIPNITYNDVAPIRYIKSAKSIRATILNLLDGVPDDQFVYWCLDDIYPVRVYNQELLNDICYYIENDKVPKHVDAIRTIRKAYHPLRHNIHNIHINKYKFDRLNLGVTDQFYGFWFHYFIRCKTLKRIFLRNDLSIDYKISEVNTSVTPQMLIHNIYLPPTTLMLFGETSRRNKITQNCIIDAKRFGVILPAHGTKIPYSIYNNNMYNNADKYLPGDVNYEDLRHYLLNTAFKVRDDI
jgi:hypothetical protein